MTKRETIITTATSLFNQKAILLLVLIALLLNQMLQNDFYKYFSSKEALIEECLYKRNLEIQYSILEK